jgi:hypothetical protein
MNWRHRWVVGTAVALLAMGCAAPPRKPAPPPELEHAASVLGDPSIRSWDIDLNEPFINELVRAAGRGLAGLDSAGGAPPTSYFLALSGGGPDGAFGAGLLCGWTVEGSRPEFTVVTGVSTGALIAPFAFLGPRYDDKLRQLYTTVNTRQIALQRSLLAGLRSDAAMNTAPLRRMIEQIVDEAMVREIAEQYGRGRILVVATTNFDAGRAVIWNIGAIAATGHPKAIRLIHDVLMASAAIPAVFPPVMIRVEAGGHVFEEMHMDGGTKAQVFLYPPSLDLRAQTEARGLERRRVAFVIRNARLDRERTIVPRSTLPIARRAIGSLIQANGIGDLFRIYLTSKRDNVEFNLAAIPATFTTARTEEFDPVYMKALFTLGFEMASAPSGFPWQASPPGWAESDAAKILGSLPITEPRTR